MNGREAGTLRFGDLHAMVGTNSSACIEGMKTAVCQNRSLLSLCLLREWFVKWTNETNKI